MWKPGIETAKAIRVTLSLFWSEFSTTSSIASSALSAAALLMSADSAIAPRHCVILYVVPISMDHLYKLFAHDEKELNKSFRQNQPLGMKNALLS